MSEEGVTQAAPPDPAKAHPVVRYIFLKTTLPLLLLAASLIGGYVALGKLVREQNPDLAIPQAIIQTEWPGADPEIIEAQVTDKIEQELLGLKNMKRVRSASFNSFSVIVVEFRADADQTESMRLVRDAVRDAEAKIADEAEKPTVTEVSVDLSPVLTVSLTGNLPPALIGATAKRLKDKLRGLQGVNEVDISGRRKEVVHVRLLSDRLAALQVTPDQVVNAIKSANIDYPWERLESPDYGPSVRLRARFRDVRDLQNLVVARKGERPVKLREVADVRRDLQRETVRTRLSYQRAPFEPTVCVDIKRSPGADTLDLIARAKATMEEAAGQPDWPAGLRYHITADQSEQIIDSLSSVFNNGWQAVLCVFIVLLVVLTWREALMAGLAIPVTLCAVLAVLWAIGYTLNQMVIVGMVLALGLLVDDFILVMEGMHEHLFAKGYRFGQAALATLRQYAIPSLTGSATTIVAFLPLALISGTDGKFMRLIPITAAACLIASYLISMVMVVPLSRLVLGRGGADQAKTTWMDRVMGRVQQGYVRVARQAIVRNRWTATAWIVGGVVLLAGSLVLMSALPVMLYPKDDSRKLGITVELPPETTLEQADVVAQAVGEMLRIKPYFESVIAYTGQTSPMARNSIASELQPNEDFYLVGFSCQFTRKADRGGRYSFTFLDDIREELSARLRTLSPGCRLLLVPESTAGTTEDPVQIQIRGDDLDVLRRLSKQTQMALMDLPGAIDVRDSLGPKRSSVTFYPRREALDFFNITLDNLGPQIRYAMVDTKVGEFATPGTEEDLDIRVSYAWPSRRGRPGGPTDMTEATTLQAFSADGKTVCIDNILRPTLGMMPVSITRVGGDRSVVVSCQVADGHTATAIFEQMDQVLSRARNTSWPTGYDFRFLGEAESSAETYGSAGEALLLAIGLVFAILVLQFASFRQPFAIMFSVPLAMIGVGVGFYILQMPFSFPAMIGLISLAGIAVNNAIVLIDTMNANLSRGMDVRDAAASGGGQRLRPIVTTTVTTLVGLIPLALSNPVWAPLCSAIIFGLITATIISLGVIPAFYIWLTREPGKEAT